MSCLLRPTNKHIDKYNLMGIQQSGAKTGWSGTIENLLIVKIVVQDCYRGNRSMSMPWKDVNKAFDLVDHAWLNEMLNLHRFLMWLSKKISRLCCSWNTFFYCFIFKKCCNLMRSGEGQKNTKTKKKKKEKENEQTKKVVAVTRQGAEESETICFKSPRGTLCVCNYLLSP